MDIAILITAFVLVLIQGHRNWLMVQAAKNQPVPQINNVTREVTVGAELELDYDKLAEALSKVPAPVINAPVTVLPPTPAPVPVPYYHPTNPTYPYYVVSDSSENQILINETPAKVFPASLSVDEGAYIGRAGSDS